MPRNGSDIYFIPPGTEGFPDTTIESEKYNNYIHDVETDLNRPRPISSGGTGADDADEALANLHAEKAGQLVTNFDSHVWMAGSFYSTISATAPPVALHAFSGIAHITDANNMVVHAVDLTDPFHTPWSRVKTAGVWGAWIRGSSYASIISADDPPADVPANTLWFESSTGLLYIRYDDGDTTQWTIACPQPDISTYALKTDVATDLSDVNAVIADLDAAKVAKAGDEMTGPLVLPHPPTLDGHATTKLYVDETIGSAVGRFQRISLGGGISTDIPVPAGVGAVRFSCMLIPGGSVTLNPRIQASVSPGVFITGPSQYTLNGFYHSSNLPTSINGWVDEAHSGFVLSGGHTNPQLPIVSDGSILLKRPNTNILFAAFITATASTGPTGPTQMGHLWTYMAYGGPELNILSLRVTVPGSQNLLDGSYINVEWI